ncbi:pilus assembly protein [Stenotrophomonas sp. Betaine-02u-21]|uniref:pilus assembly protein n=1 Tax=unclassified Stenotrophomonas TaxID=196198 RepID=UPI000C32DCC8|nr:MULTISPECIES: pilus assembly protein [unclassified Stenotrophomonas]PKH70478.1 pilus assembly protein [Stenotrophomonas sp. Betaine-02u-23]PKH73643.1 pilus assembly protein [Stenotrophomonas sp. Betaine-02u-21]PKH94820.1 pilus assembly protein [Stenotrophomonas sp. Bg11-02]
MEPFVRTRFSGLALALFLSTPAAHANLTIHPMRASVEPGKATVFRVYSQSTQAQFVQASLRHIVDPAGDAEHEADVAPSQAAIALTPYRFALAGGGNRLIRIIPLQPVQQETAYRVYFEGVRAPDEEAVDAPTDGAQASIGVSLVWGALVNVLPADGRVQVELRGRTLHNIGTLRMGITSVVGCSAAGACATHEVSRSLYPGASLQLPAGLEVGSTLQLRYRLTGDGYREHLLTLPPVIG